MRRLRRHLLAELRVEARERGVRARGGVHESARASAVPLREGAGAERETPLERLLARMTAEERVRSFATPGELAEPCRRPGCCCSASATAIARLSRTSRGNGLVSLRRHRRFDAASSGGWETPTQPSSMRSVSSSRSRRAGTQGLSPISMATAPSPRSLPPRPRGRRSTSSASSRAPPAGERDRARAYRRPHGHRAYAEWLRRPRGAPRGADRRCGQRRSGADLACPRPTCSANRQRRRAARARLVRAQASTIEPFLQLVAPGLERDSCRRAPARRTSCICRRT